MISFDHDGERFKYCAAGLCIHDGHVLLTKAEPDDYWILPGGRVELSEDTRTTLSRELLEETGCEAEIKDLLLIVENFFHLEETNYHELAFPYSVSPKDPAILKNTWTHRTTDGSVTIELRWFDLNHLETINLRPDFLKPFLKDPPKTPQHMIVREPHQQKTDS